MNLRVVIPIETEHQAADLAKDEGTRGRARHVLRHPDLAVRLCKQPLNYNTPQQWSGYIPPRECGGMYNHSPQRRALVEICAEAWRRETAAQQSAQGGTG